MSYDIVSATECATFHSNFEVPASKGGSYIVSLSGGEGPAHCQCKGYQFHGDCKHIKYVWEHACLWHPQWHDPGPGTLKPVWTDDRNVVPGERCPGCGGPVIAIRIAV